MSDEAPPSVVDRFQAMKEAAGCDDTAAAILTLAEVLQHESILQPEKLTKAMGRVLDNHCVMLAEM